MIMSVGSVVRKDMERSNSSGKVRGNAETEV